MKIKITFIIALFIAATGLAQNVTITPNGITPLSSTNYLRLSYDAIIALPNPQDGDIAYDLTYKCLRVYTLDKWLCSSQDPQDPSPNIAALTSIKGSDVYVINDMKVNSIGDIYVIGFFSGTINFGNITKTSAGSNDIFFGKYNKNGTVQWIKTVGNITNDMGQSIAIDLNGDLIITGTFGGTVDFGGTNKTANSNDFFLAKYNNNGSLIWVQSAGGNSVEQGEKVAVDLIGNIYIIGSFLGTTTIGNTSKLSAGNLDIFFAKYNSNGVLQNVQFIGGTLSDIPNDILIGSSGQIYLTGTFKNTVTFGAISKTANGLNSDIFLASFDPITSVYQWVNTISGIGDEFSPILCLTPFRIILGFNYSAAVTINSNNGGSTNILKTTGDFDFSISAFSYLGTSLGPSLNSTGSGNEKIRAIINDGSENIYFTGDLINIGKIGNVNILSKAGDQDIYVGKLNFSQGTSPEWLITSGGIAYEEVSTIGIDASNNIFITGKFTSNPLLLGNTKLAKAPIDPQTGNNYFDIFFAKLQQQP